MTNVNNLPLALRENALFCCWRYEERNGRRTKIPYNPITGGRAQSNNPDTFTSCSVAADAMKQYSGLGVGIFGSLGAIDIDHCVKDGIPNEMAKDIIEAMHSYTELSPSGDGIRILFWATGFQYDTGRYYINNQKVGLEVYIAGCTKKYVTVTGNVLIALEMGERNKQLAQVLERYMVRVEQNGSLAWNSTIGEPGEPPEMDDAALIRKAQAARNGDQFSALWNGNCSGYQSHSEADQALCNLLAFWTGKDAARMDALFRQSGLMREKWDRKQSGTTYGQLTIQSAIAGCREVYTHRTQSEMLEQKPQPDEKREKGQNQREPPGLQIISAEALQNKELPPVEWVVNGMLTCGFGLLASPPKYGKSWWVLDLGLAVASGGGFMGRETVPGRCLYLALEDSENRLKSRMNRLLNGQRAPAAFDFATRAEDMDHGLLSQLEGYVIAYPDTRLIIIDTLQKVRGAPGRTEGAYQADYREAGRLKTFADNHHLCVLCVHHLRKMGDDGDPFNRISGTNGLLGAADTAIVMTRNKRNDVNTTLSVTGRDVEPSEEVISFDRETCRWRMIGSVDRIFQQSARMEYEQEPMVQAVRKLMEKYPDGWEGNSSKLMEECVSLLGYYPETSTKGYTTAIKRLKPQLRNYDGIHVCTEGKTGGRTRIRIYCTCGGVKGEFQMSMQE